MSGAPHPARKAAENAPGVGNADTNDSGAVASADTNDGSAVASAEGVINNIEEIEPPHDSNDASVWCCLAQNISESDERGDEDGVGPADTNELPPRSPAPLPQVTIVTWVRQCRHQWMAAVRSNELRQCGAFVILTRDH